jgi:hypothetical protein
MNDGVLLAVTMDVAIPPKIVRISEDDNVWIGEPLAD